MNLETNLSPENGDGFKFAVTIIVAFSTIAYKIYDFIKNNPVNEFWYNLLGVIIPVSLTIIGLLAYLIIKGISFEIDNEQVKKRLKHFSSLIYILTFLIFFWYIVSQFLIKAFSFLIKEAKYYFKDEIIIYIEILLSLFILVYSFSRIIKVKNLLLEKNLSWENLWDLNKVSDITFNKFSSNKKYEFFIYMYQSSLFVIYVFILFIFTNLVFVFTKTNIDWNRLSIFVEMIILVQFIGVVSYIWNILLSKFFISNKSQNPQADKIHFNYNISNLSLVFSFIVIIGFCFTPNLLAGQIRVSIDENYFAKNNQIPVDIINTGHNENITVNLSNKNAEGNITILDTIRVSPIENAYPVISGNYLRITTLDFGKHKVYINTTNLTQGHYEFSVVENPQKNSILPVEKKSFNSFYLDK